MRSPFTEDDCRNGDKALAADRSRHELGDNGQSHGCAAKACKETGNYDADVADFVNINAQCISCGGMLTYCAKVQSPFCPVKDPDHKDRQDQRQNGRHIDIEVIQASLKP